MPTDCISYQNSAYFSPLINDYLDQKENLNSLYNRFPNLENFELQILEKEKNYNNQGTRKVLVSVLESQYHNTKVFDATAKNINLLNKNNSFTITTGHQLNLFTGPLYFLHKIVSTIKLTQDLKAKFPESNFVPIYWMATEDHDFEEINYFNFKDQKYRWKKSSAGPVGRLSTKGLDALFEKYEQDLGIGKNAEQLKILFQESYLKHPNLADATRFLTNQLFGECGLVIIDGDNHDLKKLFIPYLKKELIEQTAYKNVLKSIEKLKNYAVQVNPREINLFFIEDNLRERIIIENGKFKINNTQIEFSKKEILEQIEKYPEKFSPNVIMRPLYQEIILPNLCYIGGGGEIAYWLELKSFFDEEKVTFPILQLRDSVLLANKKQEQKANKLGLTWSEMFSKQTDLINNKTKQFSELSIDFSPQKQQLNEQFSTLYEIAKLTDKSFVGAVKAQEAKQIKGLENLERRLLKAEKRKQAETMERITNLQNELFPNQSLQERYCNFSEFYLEYGTNLIPKLLSQLQPLEPHFKIIVL